MTVSEISVFGYGILTYIYDTTHICKADSTDVTTHCQSTSLKHIACSIVVYSKRYRSYIAVLNRRSIVEEVNVSTESLFVCASLSGPNPQIDHFPKCKQTDQGVAQTNNAGGGDKRILSSIIQLMVL